MDATTLFIVGIVGAGLLLVLGVLSVAARREPSARPIIGELDRQSQRRDRQPRRQKAASAGARTGSPVAVMAPPETPIDLTTLGEIAVASPPPVDPLTQREEVSPEEFARTRRSFFNRAVLAIFGIFLAQFAVASLAFLWPRLRGGFGASFNLGSIDQLRTEILQSDGSIVPKFVAEAQAWIVPIPQSVIQGSSFAGLPVVVGATANEPGLMALWQRCVHLGCRVPSCVPSQGFECPCHGSRYNFHGEYEAGPAPRNLDRFAVETDATGNLIADTGDIIQTPRAKNKTITYPQGPSCI